MSLNIKGVYWCDMNLIRSNHFIALAITEAAFHKVMKRMKVPLHQYPSFVGGNADATTHFLEQGGKRCAVVTLKGYKKHSGISICGLLVHEASHICDEIFERMGERRPSSEFKAYSLQWISQELMEAFKLLTKKKK